MIWLLGELMPYLLLAAVLGGMAGWCWHALRRDAVFGALVADRDRARDELFDLLTPDAARPTWDAGVDTRLIDLQRSGDALVRELAAERARAAALMVRAEQAEADLARLRPGAGIAGQSGFDMPPVHALAGAEHAAHSNQTRAQDPAAGVGGDAWRLRFLETRIRYLEGRLADAALDDRRLEEARAEIERLRAASTSMPSERAASLDAPVDTTELEGLRRELIEASARIGELERDLEYARMPDPRVAELERAVEALRVHEGRVGELEAELLAQREAAAAAPVAAGTLDQLQSDVTFWRELAEQSDRELAQLRSAAAEPVDPAIMASLAAAEGARDAAQAQLMELEAANTRLGARLAELERSVPPPNQFTEFEHRIAALRADLDASETARASLPDEREILRLRWRVRYLEGRIAYLERREDPVRIHQPKLRLVEVEAPVDPQASEPPQAPSAEFANGPETDAGVLSGVRPPALSEPRAADQPDDLKMISGIGPKLEDTLHGLGVFHFDQIANWTPDNIAWVDSFLKFRGRIVRERWVEQARQLEAGIETEGARRYRAGEHS
jgi:predicted flap endonuclease-1-like 5' DNA nuclease